APRARSRDGAVRLPRRREHHARSGGAMMLAAVLGTIAIVALTIAVGVVIDRRIALLPRPEPHVEPKKLPGFAAGEAPSTAIRAGGSQLQRLRGSQRCPRCRAAMAGEHDDRVRFGERELTVIGFSCPQCGAKRTIYVEEPS